MCLVKCLMQVAASESPANVTRDDTRGLEYYVKLYAQHLEAHGQVKPAVQLCSTLQYCTILRQVKPHNVNLNCKKSFSLEEYYVYKLGM